ncbi:MAG: DUF4494 domain-containing protein [Thermoflexibacteraceae bacterium]|jgi:hypothetical protein
MATWYLCKIQYMKQLEDGKMKIVSEDYLIDAVSFTDAEARIYKLVSATINEFNIVGVRKTNFRDVFNYDDTEKWFKCKMSYLAVDEGSGKEKRINSYMLVSADNPKQAYERLEEQMAAMIVPYDITDVNATTIVEVFPYVAAEDEVPANFTPIGNKRIKQNEVLATQEVNDNLDMSDRDLEIITEEELTEDDFDMEDENPVEETTSAISEQPLADTPPNSAN